MQVFKIILRIQFGLRYPREERFNFALTHNYISERDVQVFAVAMPMF